MSFTRDELQQFLPKFNQVFDMVDTIMGNIDINWIFYTAYNENNIFVHIVVSDKGDLIHISRHTLLEKFFVPDFVKRRYDFENIKLCIERDLYIAREIRNVSKSEIVKGIDKRLLELYNESNQ